MVFQVVFTILMTLAGAVVIGSFLIECGMYPAISYSVFPICIGLIFGGWLLVKKGFRSNG